MSMFKKFNALFARYKELERWLKHAGACAIGDILLNEMDDIKAPNHIELTFTDKDGKEQAIVTVVRAGGKSPAKMLEDANNRLELAENSLKSAGFTQAAPTSWWKPPIGPSSSPLLQRIDDLSAQRDELLDALSGLVDFIEIDDLNIDALAFKIAKDSIAKTKGGSENHSPDIAKMAVPQVWQLVPVEPTIEMVQAATHKSVGFGTRAAYQAMLAAAPKPEGAA